MHLPNLCVVLLVITTCCYAHSCDYDDCCEDSCCQEHTVSCCLRYRVSSCCYRHHCYKPPTSKPESTTQSNTDRPNPVLPPVYNQSHSSNSDLNLDINVKNTINNNFTVYAPIAVDNYNVINVNNKGGVVITPPPMSSWPTWPTWSTQTPSTTTTSTTYNPNTPSTAPTTTTASTTVKPMRPIVIRVPYYVPYPYPVRSGCCQVYQPCLHSQCSSPMSVSSTCSSSCSSGQMYRPVNPCQYRSCSRRRSLDCMFCQEESFYESYEDYNRCNHCFF